MSASMHQRHRVEDEELQWQHWLSSISVSWANGLKGEEEILTSKQKFFTAKKLLRYASVGIIIDCLSQSSTILPHPVTWCWWQCRCQCNACRAMQCLPRNAMHWLPKWPPTCRRKILGPRFDHFWAAKHWAMTTGKAQPRWKKNSGAKKLFNFGNKSHTKQTVPVPVRLIFVRVVRY